MDNDAVLPANAFYVTRVHRPSNEPRRFVRLNVVGVMPSSPETTVCQIQINMQFIDFTMLDLDWLFYAYEPDGSLVKDGTVFQAISPPIMRPMPSANLDYIIAVPLSFSVLALDDMMTVAKDDSGKSFIESMKALPPLSLAAPMMGG